MKIVQVTFENMPPNATLADQTQQLCQSLSGYISGDSTIQVSFEKNASTADSFTAVKLSYVDPLVSFTAAASSVDAKLALSAAIKKACAMARDRDRCIHRPWPSY